MSNQSPINENSQSLLFGEYEEGVDEVMSQLDPTTLPLLGGLKLMDVKPRLIEAFENTDIDKLVNDPPQLIADFFSNLRRMIPIDVMPMLFDEINPGIPNDKPNVKNLFLFLILMIHDSKDPKNLLNWCARKLASVSWQRTSSVLIDDIKALAVSDNKKVKSWALLDKDDHFTLYMVQNNKLVAKQSGEASNITVKKDNMICVEDSQGRLIAEFAPVDKEQGHIWQNALSKKKLPFPLVLTSSIQPLPPNLLSLLYKALISDDMILPRALIQSGVVKIGDGIKLCKALLDVFSYGRKVDQLLQMMVSNEFDNRELTATKICRENSHLTNMFKVYHEKFGKIYFEKFIVKVIKYLDNVGDIDWDCSEPEKFDSKKAEVAFFTVIKSLLGSSGLVPPQIRHLARHLKNAANIRFNTQQASFNTLSTFFLLRFVTPSISQPNNIDPDFTVTGKMQKILIPFSKHIQVLFSLSTFEDDAPAPYKAWNKRITEHVFPKLVPFVLSLSDMPEIPNYEVPSVENLDASLRYILECINKNYKKFSTAYMSYMDGKNTTPIVGWDIALFLTGFFKENNQI